VKTLVGVEVCDLFIVTVGVGIMLLQVPNVLAATYFDMYANELENEYNCNDS
jgi:uncharacterized protein involved in cysteine biosynthesis